MRILRLARFAPSVLAGVVIGWASMVYVLPILPVANLKLRGKAEGCPWSRLVSMLHTNRRLATLSLDYERVLSVEAFDPQFGIEKVSGSKRSYWIRRAGRQKNGKDLLVYLLAEQEWMREHNPEEQVGEGEVVLDCGAHVGVFTEDALRRGAARVIAIEPDPVNLECLRRNFAREIAASRVVVVPSGVWSTRTRLAFSVNQMNSGSGSVVLAGDGDKIEVPVSTIDAIVRELNLPRVDYIKMDIEGAEREALRGAAETLRRFRPRLRLETYHRADDMRVLPPIIRQARSDYSQACGPCEATEYGTVAPHVIYYR